MLYCFYFHLCGKYINLFVYEKILYLFPKIMKRKVAIIDPLGAHGSSHHFYLFGQAQGLTNIGVDVSLYTNKETDNPKISGLEFYQFYGFLFSSKFKLLNGIKYILGSIRSVFHARIMGCSVFHFHIFYTNIFIFFNVCLVKILWGKVVLTIHDVNSFASKNENSILITWIYKLTDLVLTHNEFSKIEILKLSKIDTKKIRIIPHGNYIPFISIQNDKIASRNRLKIPLNKKILLFFGMIKKVKGLEILLNSLKSVIEKNPDVLLVIAGRVWENDFSPYQKIIKENDLQEYCLLHTKFIENKDVPHYYCASDLVVLPYKKIYQSGVLMMTLSFEKGVLTSNLPPLKEILKDNENGFLFESENPTSLADKINSVLSDEKQLERVRKNGAEL